MDGDLLMDACSTLAWSARYSKSRMDPRWPGSQGRARVDRGLAHRDPFLVVERRWRWAGPGGRAPAPMRAWSIPPWVSGARGHLCWERLDLRSAAEMSRPMTTQAPCRRRRTRRAARCPLEEAPGRQRGHDERQRARRRRRGPAWSRRPDAACLGRAWRRGPGSWPPWRQPRRARRTSAASARWRWRRGAPETMMTRALPMTKRDGPPAVDEPAGDGPDDHLRDGEEDEGRPPPRRSRRPGRPCRGSR